MEVVVHIMKMVQQPAPIAAMAVLAVQEDADQSAVPSPVVTALQKVHVAGKHLHDNCMPYLLITISCKPCNFLFQVLCNQQMHGQASGDMFFRSIFTSMFL
jgi:hypothetical protein